jgi:hypothetical protein
MDVQLKLRSVHRDGARPNATPYPANRSSRPVASMDNGHEVGGEKSSTLLPGSGIGGVDCGAAHRIAAARRISGRSTDLLAVDPPLAGLFAIVQGGMHTNLPAERRSKPLMRLLTGPGLAVGGGAGSSE